MHRRHAMQVRRAMLLLVVVVIGTFVVSAATAANTVPGSKAMVVDHAVTANQLKPAQCASLDLANVVTGGLIVTGTSDNDLVLGSATSTALEGGAGDDCLVGGLLGETLVGGAGYDVCIGGSGINIFDPSCEEQH